MAERLQKIIAESGLMSRRMAEKAIAEGRVSINGSIAKLGDTAGKEDVVLLDGKMLPEKESKKYFMLNKPRGYVCTMKDERNRKSVRELLPESAGRVYPVGRLDLMSEGLLLMTNDGEFALHVMHPSGMILKTYRTTVQGDQLEKRIERLRQPFVLDRVQVCVKSLHILKQHEDTAILDITIGEGRNREIRRICEQAGVRVNRLVRISEGKLQLGRLPSGHVRELTKDEIASVMREAKR